MRQRAKEQGYSIKSTPPACVPQHGRPYHSCYPPFLGLHAVSSFAMRLRGCQLAWDSGNGTFSAVAEKKRLGWSIVPGQPTAFQVGGTSGTSFEERHIPQNTALEARCRRNWLPGIPLHFNKPACVPFSSPRCSPAQPLRRLCWTPRLASKLVPGPINPSPNLVLAPHLSHLIPRDSSSDPPVRVVPAANRRAGSPIFVMNTLGPAIGTPIPTSAARGLSADPFHPIWIRDDPPRQECGLGEGQAFPPSRGVAEAISAGLPSNLQA
ncbi:hypothetical protein B0T16DRAFT_183646 [Cercophora newfieldiana]|uniref:Uncharacterized protein n=1 Tax=Cercophora newfieldiana TaxID=92897 RepID=A0AA40CNI5_9PEZI|nr:hypothetical protein B0T16DRAFT_183646 [Cercophora newfieldiana]